MPKVQSKPLNELSYTEVLEELRSMYGNRAFIEKLRRFNGLRTVGMNMQGKEFFRDLRQIRRGEA